MEDKDFIGNISLTTLFRGFLRDRHTDCVPITYFQYCFSKITDYSSITPVPLYFLWEKFGGIIFFY